MGVAVFAKDGQNVFRAMREDTDGLPTVGPTSRTLGARLGEPEPINGLIVPMTGGMSVAIDDPKALPEHRRPPSLGGTGRDPVFLALVPLSNSLHIRQDRPPHQHGLVEPLTTCSPDEYQGLLAATRLQWRKLPS